jgi:hypothetical protein
MNSTSIHEAICKDTATKAKFCRGKDTFNTYDVCEKHAELPEAILKETSILSACVANIDLMCKDTDMRAKVCEDGLNLQFDLCPALPDGACDDSSTDRYARLFGKNWVNATMYNVTFCEAFPSLCV